MHLVCRETIFFCGKQREGGGILLILDNAFFLGPQGILTGPTGIGAYRPCILQNKTISRPLRHIPRFFFDKVLLGGPGCQDWTKIAHAQLHHEANNIRPSLGIYDILLQRRCGNKTLFTDEQMDKGPTTDRWVLHKLASSLTYRAKKIFVHPFQAIWLY